MSSASNLPIVVEPPWNDIIQNVIPFAPWTTRLLSRKLCAQSYEYLWHTPEFKRLQRRFRRDAPMFAAEAPDNILILLLQHHPVIRPVDFALDFSTMLDDLRNRGGERLCHIITQGILVHRNAILDTTILYYMLRYDYIQPANKLATAGCIQWDDRISASYKFAAPDPRTMFGYAACTLPAATLDSIIHLVSDSTINDSLEAVFVHNPTVIEVLLRHLERRKYNYTTGRRSLQWYCRTRQVFGVRGLVQRCIFSIYVFVMLFEFLTLSRPTNDSLVNAWGEVLFYIISFYLVLVVTAYPAAKFMVPGFAEPYIEMAFCILFGCK